ncbi:hypothetical protein BU24DRAFT_105041 [Aaosphaeria arxii CBS 175.79]|uniref:Uncharacterized protein n=1 Tax=Aaosphaeria arxii CBS 175.79 TaxID=1450172 RepID=A0A6A5XZY8_9PLEO|nr:uncharacterized protein BU24DRAFT_105041 [Aaosphaeria arxii CBS 175.79]KAF2018782.1 hypothetical protein BU24DRAFT_105041 [Aaosphaeria arxii CBS 175.79]
MYAYDSQTIVISYLTRSSVHGRLIGLPTTPSPSNEHPSTTLCRSLSSMTAPSLVHTSTYTLRFKHPTESRAIGNTSHHQQIRTVRHANPTFLPFYQDLIPRRLACFCPRAPPPSRFRSVPWRLGRQAAPIDEREEIVDFVLLTRGERVLWDRGRVLHGERDGQFFTHVHSASPPHLAFSTIHTLSRPAAVVVPHAYVKIRIRYNATCIS